MRVVGVHRQPGLHIGRAETGIGRSGPLHRGTALVRTGASCIGQGFCHRCPEFADLCMVQPNAQHVPKLADVLQYQVSHANLLAIAKERSAAQREHETQGEPGQRFVVLTIAIVAVESR